MSTIRKKPDQPLVPLQTPRVTETRAPPVPARPGRPASPRDAYVGAFSRAVISTNERTVGPRAVELVLSRHLKGPPSTAVREMLVEGSLSPRAVAKLEKQGVGAAALRAAARELKPHLPELGVAGESLAGAALDLLEVVGDDLSKLADTAFTRAQLDRTLPGRLADACTKGLSAAVGQAARELVQTGLVSADSFAKLGAEGLGQLSLALELGRTQLGPLAEHSAGQFLAQVTEALGKASLLIEQGKKYPDFIGDFVKALGSNKPLWEETRSSHFQAGDVGAGGAVPGRSALDQKPMGVTSGTAGRVTQTADGVVAEGRTGAVARASGNVSGEHTIKALVDGGELFGSGGRISGQASYDAEAWAGGEGRASVGLDGVNADGRAGAGASFHGEAAASGQQGGWLFGQRNDASAQADGQAYVGAEGHLHAGADGARAQVRAGAAAEASVDAAASMEYSSLGGAVSAGTAVKGHAEARAAAQVTAEGNVGFDKEGDVEAFVGVSAEAIVEASAGLEQAHTVNFFGFKFTAGAYVAVAASAGAQANAGAGYKDGKFFATAGAGAGVVAGAEGRGVVAIELPPWAQSIANGLAKTEAGRAALGAIGAMLNPVIASLAGGASAAPAPA